MLRFSLLIALILTALPLSGSVRPETERQIDALIRENKTNEAIQLIVTTLQSNPDWQPGLWRLGNLFYGADRFSPAREAFSKLTNLDEKQGAPWALLGLSDFALHDYAAAIDHIQHGLALGFPAELSLAPTCYLQLAASLLNAAKYDRVLIVLTGLAGLTESVETQQLLAGLATLRMPILPVEASRILTARQLSAVIETGSIALAVTRSEIADARPRWKNLITANPTLSGAHVAFGKYLLETGDPFAAETEFRTELENIPSDVNARLGLGFALMEGGKLDDAVKTCTGALQLEPNSANGHYLLGSLFARQGKYTEAAAELEESRDIDPNLSRVHYALAQVYLKQHRSTEAAHEAAAFKLLKGNEESFRTAGRLSLAESTKGQP